MHDAIRGFGLVVLPSSGHMKGCLKPNYNKSNKSVKPLNLRMCVYNITLYNKCNKTNYEIK